MSKRIFSAVMFILLFTSMLTLAFHIQPVKAEGTIFIQADGSIDPPTAPISTVDNVTYTFTGDIINNSIIVQRDNILLDGAGFTVQGDGTGNGIDLSNRNNVTINNTNVRNYAYGIYLHSSSSNNISGNTMTYNGYAIFLTHISDYNNISGNDIEDNGNGIILGWSSDHNSISGNDILGNGVVYQDGCGIYLHSSSSNSISGNNIINNGGAEGSGCGIDLQVSSNNNSISGNNIIDNAGPLGTGVYLGYSSGNSISGNDIEHQEMDVYLYFLSDYNSISGNNITNNGDGVHLYWSSDYNSISGNDIRGNFFDIYLDSSSSNSIFHNNFITGQQVVSSGSVNVWDNGCPSGGNYWSDYTGTDGFRGPFQNETGSDGIGDTPYVIDLYSDNSDIDRYPLMTLWVRLPGDINYDGVVDIYDAILLAYAHNSTPGKANWNPNADINGDNIIDIYDANQLAVHFNQHNL